MVTQQPGLSLRKCPRLEAGSPEVIIYTDGGCRPNPGPGGWAAILWASGMELELGGGAPDTTNNRMEMTAALAGLNTLTGPTKVTIVTDSEYVFNGMTNWITKWSGLGFTKKKGTLLNPGLWRALAEASLAHQASWAWTRGHSGVQLNERCDVLASVMIDARHSDPVAPTHKARTARDAGLPAIAATETAEIWLPD